MPIVENFEPVTVDEETVFPMAEAANYAASVLLQMLIEHRGAGPWIEEMHENMRNGLDRGPPPEGWPFGPDRWRAAQHAALMGIFAHQHMVGIVRPKQ